MTPLLTLALFLTAPADPGTLVIVGGGTIPNVIREKFIALAGGDAAKILVVPTASEYADHADEIESFLTPWKKKTRGSVAILHTRDRSIADSDAFTKPIQDCTAVWFAGGDQSRITKTYLSTKSEIAFRELLKRGGVIGGTSAGAAIMGDPMITGGKSEATADRGFAFLPSVVTDQHFLARKRQPRLEGLIAKHPGTIGLGVDEATAAVITGDRLEVLGESSVTILLSAGDGLPESELVLKTGKTADLKPMRRDAKRRTNDPK
jgi:cyanophycinase